MMGDMKRAGLNPILAAGSAGFNTQTPQVQQSTMPTGSSSSAYEQFTKAGLQEEQTKTERVEQLKRMAELKTEIMRKYEVRMKARQASAMETKLLTESQRNIKEIMLIVSKTDLTDEQKMEVAQKIKVIESQLERLKNEAGIYATDAGKILTIIREITRSLGLHSGANINIR